MKKKTPLVSIVIPVFNGANFLAEAIDSALAQTYKNIEVIVINDGSPDDGATEKIALSYGNKIRYYYKENGGISSALNYGISNMKGDFFSWLSHDDLYTPDKIQKQINLVESNKDIILCSGSLMDKQGNPINYHIKTLNKILDGLGLFREFLNGYILNGLGFLIPKSVFDREGGFDENLRYLQDLDMWLRLTWKDYRFVCIPDMLVKTRLHALQTTNTMSSSYDMDKGRMAIKHIELLSKTKIRNISNLLECYYLLCLKDNNKDGINAIYHLFKNVKFGFAFKLKCIHFKIKGILLTLIRWLRDRYYKTQKIRS